MLPSNPNSTGGTAASGARQAWTVRPQQKRPLRAMPMTRRYQVSCLDANGDIAEYTRLAPALPLFEDAFSALARGTLLTTDGGPVAIEDLVPGTRVMTAENGPEPVQWVGSMTLFPQAATPDAERPALIRVTADALGFGRPGIDVVLGPSARVLFRGPRIRQAAGTEAAFVPARAMIDGVSVIEVTPATPVTVYHLAFAGQRSLRAGGIEIESYHPGARFAETVEPQMAQFFLTLFPNLKSLDEFGAISVPRLGRSEFEASQPG